MGLRDWFEETYADINPFDKGKTGASIRAARTVPTKVTPPSPAKTVPVVVQKQQNYPQLQVRAPQTIQPLSVAQNYRYNRRGDGGYDFFDGNKKIRVEDYARGMNITRDEAINRINTNKNRTDLTNAVAQYKGTPFSITGGKDLEQFQKYYNSLDAASQNNERTRLERLASERLTADNYDTVKKSKDEARLALEVANTLGTQKDYDFGALVNDVKNLPANMARGIADQYGRITQANALVAAKAVGVDPTLERQQQIDKLIQMRNQLTTSAPAPYKPGTITSPEQMALYNKLTDDIQRLQDIQKDQLQAEYDATDPTKYGAAAANTALDVATAGSVGSVANMAKGTRFARAGQAIDGAVTKSGLGKLLEPQTIRQATASGIVQGGASGAIGAYETGGAETTADQVLSNAAIGAGIGGVMGAGLSGLSRGVSRAADVQGQISHDRLYKTNESYRTNTDSIQALDIAIDRANSRGDTEAVAQLVGMKGDLITKNQSLLKRDAEAGFIAGSNATGYDDAKKSGRVFDGVDGMPRFEVDDSGAKIKNPNGKTLGEVLDHPELFKQYPNLSKTKVLLDDSLGQGTKGSYDGKTLRLNSREHTSDKDLVSTILHETQHNIQDMEGFAKGGDPASFAGMTELRADNDMLKTELNAINRKLEDADDLGWSDSTKVEGKTVGELRADKKRFEKSLKETSDQLNTYRNPHERYKNLAGEAEARAVQARMNMSDGERYVKSERQRPQTTDNDFQNILPSGTRPDSIREIVKNGGTPLYHDTDSRGVLGILESGEIRTSQAPFSQIAGQGKRVSTTRNFDNYSRYGKAPYRFIIDERKTGQKAIPDNREEFESIFNKPVSTKSVESVAIDITNPELINDLQNGTLKQVIESAKAKGVKVEAFEGKMLPDVQANKEIQEMTRDMFNGQFPDLATKQNLKSTFYDSLDVPKEDLIIKKNTDAPAYYIQRGRTPKLHPDDMNVMAELIDHARGIRKLSPERAYNLELEASHIAERYGIVPKLNKRTNPLVSLANAFDERLTRERYGKMSGVAMSLDIGDGKSLDGLAQSKYGKPANKLTATQRRGLIEENDLVIEGGKDLVKSVGVPSKGYEIDTSRDGLVYGGYKTGTYTDGYILVDDKNFAREIYDTIHKKEEGKTARQVIKSSQFTDIAEAEAYAKDYTKSAIDSSEGRFPKGAIDEWRKGDGWLTPGYGNEAQITGVFREGVVVSDSKIATVVMPDKIALFNERYPDATFRVGTTATDPVQVRNGDVVVGLVMPIRATGVPKQLITPTQKTPQVGKTDPTAALKQEADMWRTQATMSDTAEGAAYAEAKLAEVEAKIKARPQPAPKVEAPTPESIRKSYDEAVEKVEALRKKGKEIPDALKDEMEKLWEAADEAERLANFQKEKPTVQKALIDFQKNNKTVDYDSLSKPKLNKLNREASEIMRNIYQMYHEAPNMDGNKVYKVKGGEPDTRYGTQGEPIVDSTGESYIYVTDLDGSEFFIAKTSNLTELKGSSTTTQPAPKVEAPKSAPIEKTPQPKPATVSEFEKNLQTAGVAPKTKTSGVIASARKTSASVVGSKLESPVTRKNKPNKPQSQKVSKPQDTPQQGSRLVQNEDQSPQPAASRKKYRSDQPYADNTPPIDTKQYIKELGKKQELAGDGSAKGGGLKADFKEKFIDDLSPIEDRLNKAIKNGAQVDPQDHITYQLDRSRRAEGVTQAYMNDNDLSKIIQEVPNPKEFDQYLIARHAKELDPEITTGRDPVKDAALVKQLDKKYAGYAKRIYTYNQKLLDTSVEYGLISKETAAALKKKYPEYVPLNRIFKEDELTSLYGGSGNASIGTQGVVKKLQGSERAIRSPLNSIIDKTRVVVEQGERNKAAQMLASYKDLPDNPFNLKEIKAGETIGNRSTIAFLDNGKKRVFEVDKEIADAAKNMNRQDIGLWGRIAAIPARVLRAGATSANVGFAGANVVKDVIGAAINSKHPVRIANPKAFGKALAAALNHNGKYYQELMREGVAGTSFDMYRNPLKSNIGEIRSQKNIGKRVAYNVAHPKQWYRTFENTIGRSEDFGRALQYYSNKSGFEAELGKGSAAAKLLAADQARNNSTNFFRHGSYGKGINVAIPYWNAGVQGARIQTRRIIERPVQTLTKMAVVIAAPSAMIAINNYSDETKRKVMEDIADYEKKDNIIIVGDDAKFNEKTGRWEGVTKIPVPPQHLGLHNAVQDAVESAYTGKKYDVVGNLGLISENYTTIDPTDAKGLANRYTPQGLKLVAEPLANTNLFTGNRIVPDSKKNLPAADQYGDYTSGTAKVIGKATNTSPLVIDNAIRTGFGGAGQNALRVSDTALVGMGIADKNDIRGKSVGESIASRFSGAQAVPTGQKAENRFNSLKEQVTASDAYKNASQYDKQRMLNRLQNDIDAVAYSEAGKSNNELTKKQRKLAGEGFDIGTYTNLDSSSELELPENLGKEAKTVITDYDNLDTEERGAWEGQENKDETIRNAMQSWLGGMELPPIPNKVALDWARYEKKRLSGEFSQIDMDNEKEKLLRSTYNSQLSNIERDLYTLSESDLVGYYNNGVISDANLENALRVERQLYDAGLISKEQLARKLDMKARGYKSKKSGKSGKSGKSKGEFDYKLFGFSDVGQSDATQLYNLLKKAKLSRNIA